MYRYIKSAGYHGYSMSNNAVAAYEDGEMPLSKWTKTAILNELVDNSMDSEIINIAKKMPLEQLKELFLYKSSWHHTSKMYNRTNFYSVDTEITINDVNSYLNRKSEENKPKPKYTYCKVWYSGNSYYAIYKYPNFYVYVLDEIVKVRDSSHKCEVLEYYSDVPKDAEETFNNIKSYLGE